MYHLTRKNSEKVTYGPQIAWAVVLTATSDDVANYPAEVFIMQCKSLVDPTQGAWFTAIATPIQLEEYPTDPSSLETSALQQPYFRVAEITLVSGNASDIEILVSRISSDILLLEDNLAALISFEAPIDVLS